MVSKQKSIFDKRPVKIIKKEKNKEEFVSLEDSIFASKRKKEKHIESKQVEDKDEFVPIEDIIFCTKTEEECDNNNDITVHDDEVPIEESIFAKKKKGVSSCSKVFSVDKKIDYEALFNKYKVLYMNETILNVQRLNMIDSNIYNNSCVLLEKSKKTKIMNVESYDMVKRVIKSVCTCVGDVFYSYTNMNKTLLDLISELDPEIDTSMMYHILDRSYAEVIDEVNNV